MARRSDYPSDAELERFGEFVLPEMAAAYATAVEERGGPLAAWEIELLLRAALHRAAPAAIREIFGADVAALLGGAKPQ